MQSARKGLGKAAAAGKNIQRTLKRAASAAARVTSGAGGGFGYGYGGTRRNMPWYKKMPDTPFVVDAFCFRDTPTFSHFVLTHFHSDHYGGLRSSFNYGTIYCNSVTAALVQLKLGVARQYLRVLPMNAPTVVEGVEVTLLDANHCPGSAMVLFRLKTGKTYLHVGAYPCSLRM